MAIKIASIIVVLLTICQRCTSEIKPIQPLPKDLQSYFDICRQTGDLRHNTGKLVFWTSMQQYVSKFFHSESELTPREAELLSRTIYEIMEPIIRNHTGIRFKRQASVRTRKEIRSMTLAERRNYFNVLNAAKHDTRLSPNVYDALARFHTDDNIGRGHFGPAFLSWHRIYLFIVETILRQWYDPTVTIPFWASVLDNEMTDSSQSVIWSDGFFGNGNGEINRGPLSSWSRVTPNNTIKRNIGNGNLLSYLDVDDILMRTRNSDILMPTALPSSNFELRYAGPLNYVGGNINNLQRAAYDPIFFSHLAFVDQIWERFRMGQINVGINPETDYPYDATDNRFSSSHAPDATAGFSKVSRGTLFGMRLAALTQKVGYSNRFSDIIRYENVPHCPDCSHSPHLFCEKGRCMPRTISEMAGTPDVQDLGLRPLSRLAADGTMVMDKPPPPPPIHQNEGCPRYIHIKDFNTDRLGSVARNRSLSNADKWVYLPVKVISKRSSKLKGYDDYNLYDGYRIGSSSNEFLNECTQKGYDNCPGDQDPVGKINIVSYGLNYDGFAEDFVIVDNRFGVSEGNGFLPVKKPTHHYVSDVIIAAFDSCGRACKPYCHVQGCDLLNEEFNGGLSISTRFPDHYYLSHEEAILGVWKQSSAHGPLYKNDVVPITFFCDCTDTWIWDRYIPPPWKKSADTKTHEQTSQGQHHNYHTVQNIEPVHTHMLNNAGDQSLISTYQMERTHLQPEPSKIDVSHLHPGYSNNQQYSPEISYQQEPPIERTFYTNGPPPPRFRNRNKASHANVDVLHNPLLRNIHRRETLSAADYMIQNLANGYVKNPDTSQDVNYIAQLQAGKNVYVKPTKLKSGVYKRETLPVVNYIRHNQTDNSAIKKEIPPVSPTYAENRFYKKESPSMSKNTRHTPSEGKVYKNKIPRMNEYMTGNTKAKNDVHKKETRSFSDYSRHTQAMGSVNKNGIPPENRLAQARMGAHTNEASPISEYISHTEARKDVNKKVSRSFSDHPKHAQAIASAKKIKVPPVNDYIRRARAKMELHRNKAPLINEYIRKPQVKNDVSKNGNPLKGDYIRQGHEQNVVFKNKTPPISDFIKQLQANNGMHKKETPPLSEFIWQNQANNGVNKQEIPPVSEYIMQMHANKGDHKKETPPTSEYAKQIHTNKGIYKKKSPPISDFINMAKKNINRNKIPLASDLFNRNNTKAIDYLKKALSAMRHKKETPSTRHSDKQDSPRNIDYIKKALSAMKLKNKYPTIKGSKSDETSSKQSNYKERPSHKGNDYKQETSTVGSYKKDDKQKKCQLSNNCLLDVPCDGCKEFDYKRCDKGNQIAVCIYGKYTMRQSSSSR